MFLKVRSPKTKNAKSQSQTHFNQRAHGPENYVSYNEMGNHAIDVAFRSEGPLRREKSKNPETSWAEKSEGTLGAGCCSLR